LGPNGDGGYLARAHNPPPGNIVIWRGLTRLQDITFGLSIALANDVGNLKPLSPVSHAGVQLVAMMRFIGVTVQAAIGDWAVRGCQNFTGCSAMLAGASAS
jgi:hypothetical protein